MSLEDFLDSLPPEILNSSLTSDSKVAEDGGNEVSFSIIFMSLNVNYFILC